MLKYIILLLNLYTPLHCMKSLIEKESPYRFKNLTILNYDGDEDHAIFMAKNAGLVHSNTTTNTYLSKKHPDIKNLFFRQPQNSAYDLITIYNPYMLNKKNILVHLKAIHAYLAPSGKFCFFIRTQTNNVSVPEQAFATIYSQICQLTPHIYKEETIKTNYFSDDKLKEIIWSNGYNISAYKNQTYETVIQNKCNYKETLTSIFMHNIHHHNLPETVIQQYKKQFIKLVMQRSKKNNLDQLIESWNFTKITLSKKDQLRPPIFINNSLLSTKWS